MSFKLFISSSRINVFFSCSTCYLHIMKGIYMFVFAHQYKCCVNISSRSVLAGGPKNKFSPGPKPALGGRASHHLCHSFVFLSHIQNINIKISNCTLFAFNFEFWHGNDIFFSFPKRPDWFWGSTILQLNG